MKILVSACLLGLNTRYDGKNLKNITVIEYLQKNNIVFYPLCAEQLGGLPTPREPSEIENGLSSKDILKGKGKVVSKSGKNVTNNFINGAYLVLDFCKRFGITHAILQDDSPSCGFRKISDGTFTHNKIKGVGILTQLLKDNGIVIIDNLL